MKSKIIFSFALLSALLGTSVAAYSPVYAQKDSRRAGGSAKEERDSHGAKNDKKSRRSSGTKKSEGRGDSGKARKERR